MPTEIHKDTARLVWTGHSNLEIVAELQSKYDLGESAEHALSVQVVRLRAQIKEAMELAPAAADQMARDGCEFKEIVDTLSRPYLIPNGAAVNAAIEALEKIAAEK